MTATPLPGQKVFDLHCDSPATRLSVARDEGRCDWPSCGFPATVTPGRVAEALRSHLRSHPGIDHIVFTAIGRPLSRPYLEAHLVEGRVHVKVAPLHGATPETRAIVHQLHAAILDAYERIRSTTIEITLDTAGLGRWARTVLAQTPDSATARQVMRLLAAAQAPDTTTQG